MIKHIKITPIKSETLCENCQHSVAGWLEADCHTIKCGEPCRMFLKKTECVQITPNYIVFSDKEGNTIIRFYKEGDDIENPNKH